MYLQLFEAAPLDFAHTDERTIETPTETLCVRAQNAARDPGKVAQVRDVVDLRIRGRRHGSFILIACDPTPQLGVLPAGPWRQAGSLPHLVVLDFFFEVKVETLPNSGF